MESNDSSITDNYPTYLELVNSHYTSLDLDTRTTTNNSTYEKLSSFDENGSKKGEQFGRQRMHNMAACNHKKPMGSELEKQSNPLHKRCRKCALALLLFVLGSAVGAALITGIYFAVTNLKSTDDEFTNGTSVCPTGFFYLTKAQRCYKIITNRLSWIDSKERCSSLSSGAHLAVIWNKEQDSAIIDYLKQLDYSASDVKNCKSDRANYYTSGQRIDPTNCNSTFVWKLRGDEQREQNYTNWRYDEPNCADTGDTATIEACLVYDTYGDNLDIYWNDIRCGPGRCSICEANPVDY